MLCFTLSPLTLRAYSPPGGQEGLRTLHLFQKLGHGASGRRGPGGRAEIQRQVGAKREPGGRLASFVAAPGGFKDLHRAAKSTHLSQIPFNRTSVPSRLRVPSVW